MELLKRILGVRNINKSQLNNPVVALVHAHYGPTKTSETNHNVSINWAQLDQQ